MDDVVRADALVRPLASRGLLALAGDERLVQQIRKGNDAAFEVAFERHAPSVLGFCRHMLGSREEAEDAVQQTFASAHGALQRDHDRQIALKPWLFTIARNRCVSMLRARREEPAEQIELPTAGLTEEVERRAELRDLLSDLRELPDEQRAALLLAEIGDMSHAEVAGVLGCRVSRVRALVFRARNRLIQQRVARERPCEQIQEQLANLRGGSLRRTELVLHLRGCPDCRAFRQGVKRQRQMLAAALPIAPTVGLKSSVLAAVGISSGSAGGGVVAGFASLGGATLAKVAVVGALAGGGALVGDAALNSSGAPGPRDTPAAVQPAGQAAPAATAITRVGEPTHSAARLRKPGRNGSDRATKGRRAEGPSARAGEQAKHNAIPPGLAKDRPGRRFGHEQKAANEHAGSGRARGPVEAPPAVTPVKRGPPAPRENPAPKPVPSVEAKAPAAPSPADGPPPAPPGLGKPKPNTEGTGKPR